MASEPLILSFDTSAAHCAAALLSGDRLLDARAEEMGRGQAERLLPMIEEMLADHDATWSDIDGIGVGVGPGNFTGIRISVAAARGLALGLGIPAYGVDGFAARRAVASGIPAIAAVRGQVFVDMGDGPAQIVDRAAAEAQAASQGEVLAPEPAPERLAEAIARQAAARWPQPAPPPAPVYLRPADAAPSRDLPPVLLD